MLETLNNWTKDLEKGYPTDVIYLDFCKAFDKVQHSKLLAKLRTVGIHPRIISWIAAFLTDRQLTVRIGSVFSTLRNVTSGVPQGGVLSPLLFNIYTYDLPNIIVSAGVSCCAFADDLKIYSRIRSRSDSEAIQSAIDSVFNWACEWDLPLSKDKTKLLRIGSRNPGFSYSIGGSPIAPVPMVKDLGFLVTSDLSFDQHCEFVA
nr:RNA-directed DNA polymerase (reverse transcriptase) domain containing protein [Haemonchus contortus]